MLTLLILAPILLVFLIIARIVRLIVHPLRYRHRYGRHLCGYDGAYNDYSRAFYPRHRFGGGLFSILLLVAIDRLTRRW